MTVEGCGKIIKYAMIIANFIILVCGVAVFSVGVWILADKSYMERLIGSSMYVSSAAILIASGVIVVIISFLGCMGAYKEVKCMLIAFFVILFIIFIIMLVGGILGYVFRDEVDEKMKEEMLESIPLYGNDSTVTETWDRVQQNMKCCGLKTEGVNRPYLIWKRNSLFEGSAQKVPDSCCMSDKTETCRKTPDDENSYANVDCYEKADMFVKDHALIIGGVGVGIACVLILGMVLSCALTMMIRK
ncbi:CD151 antigen-like [Tachypleus tridentatus]|uniref:CD151 antigen-like n=1 Tax=Tachypleus tridentatus TaxID=6853 RepID=UPI003FD1F351